MVGVNEKLSQFKDIRGRVLKVGDKVIVSSKTYSHATDLNELSVKYVASFDSSSCYRKGGCVTVSHIPPFGKAVGITWRVWKSEKELLIIEW